MSLQLLLEDFLGLMKEEGELDVYLPLLLSAMGHEIVYWAQKGTRQYGVDIVSVGVDKDGRKKLFLWLVKCGDIGRSEWSSGEQSIRPSIEDVGDVYLKSHIAPQHRLLIKKLVVLTNGEYKASIAQTLATYLSSWSDKHEVETEIVNGSTLAAWSEAHLLDEHVLPPESKTLFRRMLANVSAPELCIQVGRMLVTKLLTDGLQPAKSANAKRKRQLGAMRAVRMALRVLFIWGQNEGNLLASYRLAEFSLLALWSHYQLEITSVDKEVVKEYSELLIELLRVGDAYHLKLDGFYAVMDAFATVLPDNLLVTERVFDELGRLGLQGFLSAQFGAMTGAPHAIDRAHHFASRVRALIASHGCAASPCYDNQSIDVHVALLCLVSTGLVAEAKEWLSQLIARLANVSGSRLAPSTATFHEALELRHGYAELEKQWHSTSTLVPILAFWTAALEMSEAYQFLRTTVVAKMSETTMNVWSSDAGFDGLLWNPQLLFAHGVGEALHTLQEDPADLLAALSVPLTGVASIVEASWYSLRSPYLPLLAAVHWRLQAPREMLVKHIGALTTLGGKPGEAAVVG